MDEKLRDKTFEEFSNGARVACNFLFYLYE